MGKIKGYDFIILFSLMIIGGIICLFLGQDANWDLANYHYYSVWALFHGRIGFDIMPCGIQSYFNPLIDFPFYLLVKFFNNMPHLISFIQSFWWGIAVFFGYKIASLIYNGKFKIWLRVFSVAIGASGVLSILEVGMTFGDLNIAALVLAAMFLILKNIFNEPSRQRTLTVLFAALLLGFALGLKTNASMAIVGLLISVVIFRKKIPHTKKMLILLIGGILLGTLATGGGWYAYIWQKFGNPFFPFYNDFFKSPLAEFVNHIDTRHLPKSAFDFIFYPILWTVHKGENYVLEFPFTDYRHIALFFAVPLIFWFHKFYTQRNKRFKIALKEYVNVDLFNFLTMFLTATYLFWLKTSATLRYLQFIEIISGIFLAIFLVYILILTKSEIKARVVALVAMLSIIATTQYCPMQITRVPFAEKFMSLENLELPDNAVLCQIGGFPSAWFMPFQNPKAKFVYLYGEIDGYNFKYPKAEIQRVKDIIKKADKSVYLIYSDYEPAYVGYDYVKQFVNTDDFACRRVYNDYMQVYYFCSLKSVQKPKKEFVLNDKKN